MTQQVSESRRKLPPFACAVWSVRGGTDLVNIAQGINHSTLAAYT